MLPTFVINLDREPQRLAAIARQLDGLGLPWQRVAAVDAAEVPRSALVADYGGGALARAFPATAGDMACALSHREVWTTIARGAADAAIVLEDDARLGPGFPAFADPGTAALMAEQGMGLLKIEFWPGPEKSRRQPLGERLGPGPGGTTLYRLRSGFLGTCGYVITAKAATLLVRRFSDFRVPVDHFLFGPAAGRAFPLLRPGFVNPAPVFHDVEAFESSIRAARLGEGLAARPRSPGRRLRDLLQSQLQAAALRRGLAEIVEMRFAGA